eukprot:jgi/Tetstr1/455936/TSEL_042717.t1
MGDESAPSDEAASTLSSGHQAQDPEEISCWYWYWYLSDNQLTGTVPPQLSTLTGLDRLYLNNNQLTGTVPPQLSALTGLEWLYLSYNQLTGTVPPQLSTLTGLDYLYLYSNQLTGTVPPQLSALTGLDYLSLRENQLTGTVPPQLSTLTGLSGLSLRENQLTGTVPPQLSALTGLTWLYLHNNQLTGTVPPQLSALTGLIHLDLSNSQLTGTVPPQLSALTGLNYLWLDNNQLTGTVPPQLSTLTGLDRLDLSNSQLTGTVPPQLSSLTGLTWLYLSYNQLTGAVPQKLSTLTGLSTLYLNNNTLTGTVPPQLSTLTGLSGLSLRENQLTGTVPPQLSALTGLTWLRLSNNQLTGTVPPQLTALTGLDYLYLNDNTLTGTVPPQLSALTGLDLLWLDNNQLTGTVPLQLSTLTGLDYLDVSNNFLSTGGYYGGARALPTQKSRQKAQNLSPATLGPAAATIAATYTTTVSAATIAAATYTTTVSTTTITAATYTTTVSTTTIAATPATTVSAATITAATYTTTAMRPLQPGSHRQAVSLRRISSAQLEAALGTAPHALGRGGFGSVFRGTLDGSPVAIKMMNEEGLQGRPEYRTEVELLARLRHRHIVAIYAACEERHAMVMELLEGGTLEDRLREGDVAWNVRLRMMYDACVGLLFLHNSSPAIMHRDFKPSNILLSQSGMAKLGDVGLAKEAPLGGSRLSTHSSVVGSLGFIDLQYLNTGVYRAASDVYSVGVTLLLVLLGRTDATGVVSEMVDARADGDEMDMLDRRPGAGSWDMEKAARVMSLALQCVHSSHLRRPTLEAVVEQLSEFKDAVPANQGSSMSATLSGRAALNMEEWLTCPLSMDLMEDPVLAEDGWTYERAMIQEHLRHRAVSPMTNLPIGTTLMPNRMAKSLTEEWRSRNSG